ncbi:MAG: type II toxin-antitoxin system RelE/ParE family toxin [bacterium]
MKESKTVVNFYKDSRGKNPVLEWIKQQEKKVRIKLGARIKLLGDYGHNLERPYAAPLRDDIYELRVEHKKTQYRILYGFYARAKAVLLAGLKKKTDKVSEPDIDKAVKSLKEVKKQGEDRLV